jgi:DNA-binding response OmpR family regulator
VQERILVVEDDEAILELISHHLRRAGWEVRSVSTAADALQEAAQWRPALVVLDLLLPDQSGLEVCRQLYRDFPQDAVPGIIMLTALGEETDRIVGLQLGADDYLTKPFSPRELVARIGAVLRRRRAPAADSPQVEDAAPLTHGALQIHPQKHRVVAAGQPVELTSTQFAILAELARRPGVVWTRDQLLQSVWGDAAFGDRRTVDVHVMHIRQKLTPMGLDGMIETVRGIGYRLRTEESSE